MSDSVRGLLASGSSSVSPGLVSPSFVSPSSGPGSRRGVLEVVELLLEPVVFCFFQEGSSLPVNSSSSEVFLSS